MKTVRARLLTPDGPRDLALPGGEPGRPLSELLALRGFPEHALRRTRTVRGL